jgi:glutathione S-transferase
MAGVELLPKEYGYVVIVLVLYCFLNIWMSSQVGRARKKYNVLYPTMYANEAENKDAKIFNCIQRGHQNSLEMMPMFFMLMILGGIRHPLISASLGVVYTVSRFFYFKGYSTGDPRNRLSLGKYGFLAAFGLMICTVSCGVHMLIS